MSQARNYRLALMVVLASCLPMAAQTSADVAQRERQGITRFEHKTEFGGFQLGVSYTGRTLIAKERSVLVRNHLVVEVLLVPQNSNGIRLSQSAFRLRINGEKNPRLPQSPGVVAYAVRNVDLQMGPQLIASGGYGNAGVVVGGSPRTTPRFPGDPRVEGRRTPQRPDGPNEADAAALDAEAVTASALPNSVITEPTAGYLYFPAKIDLNKVKTLELIFAPDEEGGKETTVRLR